MNLSFSYNHSLASPEKVERFLWQLCPLIKQMADVVSSDYIDSSSFAKLPFDQELHKKSCVLAQKKRALKPKLFLLIGIGGSNLGTLAVHEALQGLYYNDQNPEITFYHADTVDPDKTAALKKIMIKALKQGDRVLITIVTKSGTTIETVDNAAVFIDLLKQYHPNNYADYLVMITDKQSLLWSYSKAIGASCLEVPQKVGGRYSVFSPVGIFPLEVLGVDTQQLLAGAQEAFVASSCVDKHNYAAASAALLCFHNQQGLVVHDTFIFDVALESLGKWYRQLMAESLGKDGKGMLPTVSMGTVDLHSMIQLYLGGPAMSFTSFITTKSNDEVALPEGLFGETKNSSINNVLSSIVRGVQETYEQENKPFVSYSELKKDAYSIGFFLQLKMFEIVYLGNLMGVNPYDQPQVELYKKNVKRI